MPIEGRDDEFISVIGILYERRLGRAPDPGGLASWLDQLRHGMTGDQLDQALADSPEGKAYQARRAAEPPPAEPLRITGPDFIAENGSRRVLVGCDAFTAFRTVLNGGDLTPLLTESRTLGFNLWRVFFMGSRARNGILQLSPTEPHYYEAVRPFADVLNAAGIVLLATIFVDAQDIMPVAADRFRHWRQMANYLRGSVTLLSTGNEFSKNGFHPREFDDPQLLWSRGSDVGDRAPYAPYGSFAEFHPRRDLPGALLDSVASPVTLSAQGLDVPLLIDEPPRMGTDGSDTDYADPHICWQFARSYATFTAGAIFHNRNGQRGELLDPTTRACAEAWVRGMRL